MPGNIEYAAFSPELLPAIVRFWNREFSARRNFIPATGDLLRRMIFQKQTAVEEFDPARFLVAMRRGGLGNPGKRAAACRRGTRRGRVLRNERGRGWALY